jgi:hypothetical protein
MTATAERIANMARSVRIDLTTFPDRPLLVVDFHTPAGKEYWLSYSEKKPYRDLLEDLTVLLPGEGVTGEDCERIIDIWAERAHEHKAGVPA